MTPTSESITLKTDFFLHVKDFFFLRPRGVGGIVSTDTHLALLATAIFSLVSNALFPI